jgi:hypothetical protein
MANLRDMRAEYDEVEYRRMGMSQMLLSFLQGKPTNTPVNPAAESLL